MGLAGWGGVGWRWGGGGGGVGERNPTKKSRAWSMAKSNWGRGVNDEEYSPLVEVRFRERVHLY